MTFLNTIFQPLSNLGQFWQQKNNSKIFRWNLFFIIIQIGFLAWRFNDLPPQVPLYYSLPWGESQLASTSALFLLPTLSIAIVLINHLFAISFSKNIILLSRLLLVISLVISFFSLITLIKIVNLIV